MKKPEKLEKTGKIGKIGKIEKYVKTSHYNSIMTRIYELSYLVSILQFVIVFLVCIKLRKVACSMRNQQIQN